MTRSALGISPISSFPYVTALLTGLSLGICTMAFNVPLIAIQKLVLRRDFTIKEMIMQAVLSLVFSAFIDLSIFLFGWFTPQSYIGRLAYLLFGCVVLALGVSMVVMANFAILPGEGAAKVIARVLKKEFGTGKIIFDCSCVVLAIVLSLIGLGRIEGIREGTVIAALLIGTCSKFIMRFLRPPLQRFLGYDKPEEPVPAAEADANELEIKAEIQTMELEVSE